MPVLNMNTEKPINVIPYKYSFGESVIYIDLQTGTAKQGEVVAVSTYNDGRNKAINYTLRNNQNVMVGNVPETVMFRTRDEVLNWAIDIANSLE